MSFDHSFRQSEVFAVQVVEAGCDVARHLDVLDLVAAHGHFVGVEHEDVCSHEYGVHEQARGHAVVGFLSCQCVFVHRCLVGVRPVEHAFACDTGEQPGELGDFGYIALAVEEHFVGVQSAGQPGGGNFQGGSLNTRRVTHFDEGVVVGKEIEVLVAGLLAGAHSGANGAHIVAQVGGARCSDAGEYALNGHGVTENKEVKTGFSARG